MYSPANSKNAFFFLQTTVAALMLALGVCCPSAQAQVLQYQARVTDPVTGEARNGLFTMTFRLYETAEGGTALWMESKDVAINNGLLTTALGDTEPLPEILDGRTLWLGVKVGADAEAAPRQLITPVAYAVHAATAGKAITLNGQGPEAFAPAYHEHRAGDITNGLLEESVIPETVARIYDIMPYLLNEDGEDSLLDADFLDGLDSTDFWKRGGNAVNERNFIGTITPHQFVLMANNEEVLQLEYPEGFDSPNILGGYGYIAPGVYGATISGGGRSVAENRIFSIFGTISGGEKNEAGTSGEIAATDFATVGGGTSNKATAGKATVGGGGNNLASGTYSFIGGGTANVSSGNYSTVSGGFLNAATGPYAAVGGGGNHQVAGEYATVSGGKENYAAGAYGAVGGGNVNFADGAYSAVGGGKSNSATEEYATVSGGLNNVASGQRAAVGGGNQNDASGNGAVVSGGNTNAASGISATIGGGYNNTAGDYYATVPGGQSNEANAIGTFAAGQRAKANHVGAFVWGDNLEQDVASDRINQVKFRASGGMRIITMASGLSPAALTVESTTSNGVAIHAKQTSSDANLVLTNPGTGNLIRGFSGTGGSTQVFRVENDGAVHAKSFTPTSDKNAKENFDPVDAREVLEKVAELPISTWNFKGDDTATRHLGPMAQDFREAFGLGDTDTGIATVDLDGVALAAIQGLHQRSKDLERENTALRAQLDMLAARLTALEQAGSR